MYLLDTNIVSEPIKPKPNQKIVERLFDVGADCSISSISWHELWFGMQRLPKSKRRNDIKRYFLDVVQPTFEILPYDAASAAWHGVERARLQSLGVTPPFADGQIAAIAHRYDLILVTLNEKDFVRFADIKIEIWG